MRNLHKCAWCGRMNRIVNECRCDPNNLPTCWNGRRIPQQQITFADEPFVLAPLNGQDGGALAKNAEQKALNSAESEARNAQFDFGHTKGMNETKPDRAG